MLKFLFALVDFVLLVLWDAFVQIGPFVYLFKNDNFYTNSYFTMKATLRLKMSFACASRPRRAAGHETELQL